MDSGWAESVLRFWFHELKAADWFGRSEKIDSDIRKRFLPLWKTKNDAAPDDFLNDGDTAIAAVLLFDQFPRNMFREDARAFATDNLALTIARKAIVMGFDCDIMQAQRQFLYMPFMHSESLNDQQRSVALFQELGDDNALKFAISHSRHNREVRTISASQCPVGTGYETGRAGCHFKRG